MWPFLPTFIYIVDTYDTTVYAHFPKFKKKKKERGWKNTQPNPSNHHNIIFFHID